MALVKLTSASKTVLVNTDAIEYAQKTPSGGSATGSDITLTSGKQVQVSQTLDEITALA